MGANATKEDHPDRRGSAPEHDSAGEMGSADSSQPESGAASPIPMKLNTSATSRPVDIPRVVPSSYDESDTPPIAAWVGSAHSPPNSIPQEHFHFQPLEPMHSDTDGEVDAAAALNDSDMDGVDIDATDVIVDAPSARAQETLRRVVFCWKGMANEVGVSGSFNDWGKPVSLKRVERNSFKVELDLSSEPYEYKYIVDGVWKHDPLAPVVASGLGSLNNILSIDDGGDVSTAVVATAKLDSFEDDSSRSCFGRTTPPGEYSQDIPPFSESDIPPQLPPHLNKATLNSEPLKNIRNDPSELPVPNHVVLDHLYAQSVKDRVLVLGATHRYKKKYVTTVMYKPTNVH
eukprot:m.359548 g.359548  ORF g.359548 m.359548 type:complete len:345 (-) comp20759_c0_seq3:370-1404(-)